MFKNDLPKIKDGAYVINLGEYKPIETHWITLYVSDNVTYFDSFRGENIPKEIKKLIGNKNITTNNHRKQAYNSMTCGYFCIEFIDFMLKSKNFLEYTNLFSGSKYEKNNKIILHYFQKILKKLKLKKSIVLFVLNIEKLKTLKYHAFLKKHCFLLFAESVEVKMKGYLKKKNQLKY